MNNERNMNKRFLGYFFALTLVFTMLFGLGVTASAADKTVLAFTSDVHNGGSGGTDDNTSGKRLQGWLDSIKAKYGEGGVDVMGFCGDMGPASSSANTFWSYVEYATGVVTNHSAIKASNDGRAVITTGNHEYSPGSFNSANSDAKKLYKIGDEGRNGSTYRIYCLGTASGSSYSWGYTSDQATALTNYLNSVDNSKPIFVLTHFPLHIYTQGNRTTNNASLIIDALNKAVDKNGQKIILLWGHNHTVADPHYDKVYLPGAGLKYSSSSEIKGIKFYYAAAGSMADSEYGQSGQVKGKGLIVTIDENQDLDFTYYDKNGTAVAQSINKTGDGTPTDTPSDGDDPEPQTGDTVNITPSTDKPEQSIKIGVGDTLTINVKNGSSNSAYDFTATVANSSIAQIQGNATKNIAAGATSQFTVKGLAEGTVDITIQNSNSYSSSYNRVGTIHLTVGEGGGTTPVNPEPQTGDTVNITPTTDKPEESIKIAVGDKLTINVKNGSQSDASYDFTATLSGSNGVARLVKGSTGSIAAGATGQITVEGLAEGTVDINIQNENQYGSQYIRKGVVHLTVGEGGSTPVDPDPQTGDKVSVTPTTSKPERSITINVGDTLTIDVTNGSEHDNAWDFTAELSKSGIAEIQGNSTINLAAGATGQFKVKGLAKGTVDVNIQNINEREDYVRKAVVHVTVVETAPHTHTWDEGEVTTPATCTEKGVRTFTCTGCKETKTEDIDPLGHDYKVVEDTAVAATCTAAGKEADKKCSRCNDVIEGAVIEALGHDYQEVEGTAVAATCTKAGKEADKKCSRCNDVIEGAAIDALGHDYQEVKDSAVAATCTTAGKKADQKCSRCDDIIEGEVIPATGHEFGEWKTIKEATDTAAGLKARSCAHCDEIEYEEIPKTTPAADDSKKTDPTTPTDDPKKSGDSKTPTAEELAKAPVDNSLPVINPEKIKTTGSMSKQTMTIKLGNINMDNCLVEYKEASASKWTSVWYGQGNQLVIKNMKKNGFYQYRFTVVKKINGQWRKSKPSNTCYRWIKNVKAKKPVAGKKRMTVKWKKVKKANGYEIQYATNKAFTKNLKKVTVKGAKKTSKTIKKLKKGKTYYVRIRPYKTKGGKKYLGILTTAKKVKIK